MELEQININVVDVLQYIPDFLSIKYSTIPNAGLGIFANSDIKKGTFIGNYMGEIYRNNESYPNNNYIFGTTSADKEYIIDGSDIIKSNFARFMNCCYNDDVENLLVVRYTNPGNSCIFTKENGEEINIDGYLFFYAKKDIREGEELLYDYGEAYREKLGIEM